MIGRGQARRKYDVAQRLKILKRSSAASSCFPGDVAQALLAVHESTGKSACATRFQLVADLKEQFTLHLLHRDFGSIGV